MDIRLPDETRVTVESCLGASYDLSLGEACNRWKDARYFGIDRALLAHGVWRSMGLTVRLQSEAA